MSLAIYLTDTLYFYPQGSLLFFSIVTGHFFFVLLITSHPLYVLLISDMATVCETPHLPSARLPFMSGQFPWWLAQIETQKPAVSKAPLSRFILDLLEKSWVMRKALIDVLWGAWPSVLQHKCNIPPDLDSISDYRSFKDIPLGAVSVSYISLVCSGFYLCVTPNCSLLLQCKTVKVYCFVYCSQTKSGPALQRKILRQETIMTVDDWWLIVLMRHQ